MRSVATVHSCLSAQRIVRGPRGAYIAVSGRFACAWMRVDARCRRRVTLFPRQESGAVKAGRGGALARLEAAARHASSGGSVLEWMRGLTAEGGRDVGLFNRQRRA